MNPPPPPPPEPGMFREPGEPALLTLLLARFTLRHWRGAPRQSALLAVILALGIAVYFAIRLANRAAVASFQNFTELITGENDWIVSAPAGSLPEPVLREMRDALGSLPVAILPVLETTATRPRQSTNETLGSRATFTLVGVDLVGVQNAAAGQVRDRSWFGQQLASTNLPDAAALAAQFWNTVRDPRAVFVTEALARRDGLRPGGSLILLVNEQAVTLRIAGLLPAVPEQPAPPETLLVMDLPALQALSGRTGRIDRVEFRVEPGPRAPADREKTREVLAALGGDRWQVVSPGDRREAGAVMTRAFRLNLTILSLIALLVGLYLVFQALDGAVVRRREEIGVLRSLGVTEGTLRRAWLVEAGVLGLVGGLAGALLGWAGAQVAVRFVGRTVNALYYATSADSARLGPGELLGALGLALGASLVAGWWPARAAAATPPAQILVRHAPQARRRTRASHPATGLALLAAAVLLAQLPPLNFGAGFRLPAAGYLSALLGVLGGGVVTGSMLGIGARGLGALGRRHPLVRLALSHLREPSGRHRLAAAGLLCAVAMTAGMAILVASFDTTMRGWIERTFQADLYLSSDGAQSASTQNRISVATWRAVVAHPGVADANVIQAIDVAFAGSRTMLVGAELPFARRHAALAWRDAPLDDAVFDPARNAALALVSEAFLERYRRGRGDRVTLPTPSGPQELTIAGVFSDYGNERGSIVVERRQFARWFGDELASSLILVTRPGVDPESLRSELLDRHPGLQVLTNAHLRREVLRIFRQTFAITHALEIIGVAVAVAGLGMTLASVLLERRGELTTLRALGLRHPEIARATALEGGLLALAGSGGGLLLSLGLGWLLIYVINRQTFGWTLQFAVPWPSLAGLLALVLATGTAVSYAVGRWGAALPADREE